ncbi:MAG: glycosyltransferase family 39 protein [Acidobacteriota bacterium]|nr:glycosyltransferase family 39 protein [Blastocatellia bacterium]MDW8413609.1 glycosyltransferase family 39 protein [Acidobacteriota bacterium]
MTSSRYLLLILLLTVLVFAASLQGKFVYDDHFIIVNSKSLPRNDYFSTIFTHSFAYDAGSDESYVSNPIDYYRPFIRLFFGLCFRLFGLDPFYWRLANLLVYLVAIFFCYFLVRELSDEKIAILSTLFFAVHPLHSESVAYVNGSVDTLHAAFFFPSFLLFVLYRKNGKLVYLLGGCTLFLAALFTKELALMLPLLVVLYLYLYDEENDPRKKFWKVARVAVPLLITVASYLLLRSYTYKSVFASARQVFTGKLTLSETLLTIPSVILEYLRMMLWPVDLRILRSVPIITTLFSARFLLSLVAVVLLIGICLRLPIRLKMAVGLFLIGLFPVLNISAFPQDRMLQDRYAFISLLGFCMVLAEVVVWLYSSKDKILRRVTVWTTGIVVLLLCWLTIRQNGYWMSDSALWMRASALVPTSVYAHCNAGSFLLAEGNEECLAYYKQALSLDPKATCALIGFAEYYGKKRDYRTAIEYWKKAVEAGGYRKKINMLFLAQTYSIAGDNRSALEVLKRTVQEFPDYEEAKVLYAELSRLVE